MDNEYLTIAEFAEAANVSKQAVYKRVDKDIKPFCKTTDGKKYISIAALSLFKPVGLQDGLTTEEVETPKVEHNREGVSTTFLAHQIQEKDKAINQQQETIQQLLKQLTEANQHIMRQSERITDIIDRQNKLQENYQVLLAQKTQVEELVESTSVDSVVDKPVEQPKRVGLFSRLFG